MIAPETYYETHLKGKSPKQIMRVIRGLKREIGHLKNIVEHPDYTATLYPTEETRIWCIRKYLERAKLALVEAGGTYIPSKAELKIEQFENHIPYISKIDFSIGGYFNGWHSYSAVIEGDSVRMESKHTFISPPVAPPNEPEKFWTKEEFWDEFRNLHIAEWRTNYNLQRFGMAVLDGIQWELSISFSNGHRTVKICGDNAYPYNFDRLKELFGVDLVVDDADEEDFC